MGDIRAEIEGFDELQRGFTRLSALLDSGALTRRATPHMVRAMEPLLAAARAEAPHRTGETRAGIVMKPLPPTAKRAKVEVEQTVQHGIFVDLGTKGRGRKADPYLQRAADRTQRRVLDDVEQQIGRIVEDMARGS